jgi:hypothetical protein
MELPTLDQIREKIELAGGRIRVASELGKTERTIDYWRSGKRNIDVSNWKMICMMVENKQRG